MRSPLLFLNQILEYNGKLLSAEYETSVIQERDSVTLVCASSSETTLVRMRRISGRTECALQIAQTSIVFAKNHADAAPMNTTIQGNPANYYHRISNTIAVL